MDRFRKISLHSRLWIAVLAAAALSIGTWSTAPTPANAASMIGAGIPGLYAQYPYYPYPPGYYPYYPPPAPTYSPVPSYPPQPSFTPQAGRFRRQHCQTIVGGKERIKRVQCHALDRDFQSIIVVSAC